MTSFAIILNNVGTPPDTEDIAQKIINTIARQFDLDGKICSVTASIGISIYNDQLETAEQLVKISDNAMYAAKYSGKNCYYLGSS